VEKREEAAQTSAIVRVDSAGEVVPTRRRTTAERLNRFAIIAWHRVTAWAKGPGWLRQMFLVFCSFFLFAYPVWALGFRKGIAGTALWAVLALFRAVRHVDPANMKLLRKNYNERKLMLYQIVLDMQRKERMSTEEVARFQREVLQLIVNYVRSHRLDTTGTQVFANLTVVAGDSFTVVARNQTHRTPGARYLVADTVVGVAFASGDAALTGNVYADYPDTAKGKPYRSILAIPVRSDDAVLGVVSIDSARLYHFDWFKNDLVESLAPYVALLAWTIPGKRDVASSKRELS